MDVVGVMAAYLPVVCVCTAQSRDSRDYGPSRCYGSIFARGVCTAQSRDSRDYGPSLCYGSIVARGACVYCTVYRLRPYQRTR